MPDPRKGYDVLRKGRESLPDTDYFVTICLLRPAIAFNEDSIRQRCLDELRNLEVEASIRVHCAVTMPDHLHLWITLGHTLGLSGVVRLFKGRLVSLLRQYGARWQPGFYDHRFRSDEDLLPVFLYIFLNPYRRKLVPPEESWPGYYCDPEDWSWLGHLTKEDRPEPAWLAQAVGHKSPTYRKTT